jgi:hypothetical protein
MTGGGEVSDLTVAMLAKALISSGADSIHVRPGEIPELTHGLATRAIPDVPAPDAEGVRRLCSALLPEAKLAEIEHGKRKRLKCHLGQLGQFHIEVGMSDGHFTLVLSPVVGEAELEAALGPQAVRKTQPKVPVLGVGPHGARPAVAAAPLPVVESSAHLLADPAPLSPPSTPLGLVAGHVAAVALPTPPPPFASAPERRPRRKTAIVLALLLGEFGVHHFYLGRRLAGWITLILLIGTGGFAGILLGLIAFRDAFRMYRMTDESFLRELDLV